MGKAVWRQYRKGCRVIKGKGENVRSLVSRSHDAQSTSKIETVSARVMRTGKRRWP